MPAPIPWLWLYRPPVPTARAQSIQVLHMAHAMAARGHEVTLAADPSAPGLLPADVLRWYGLAPLPTLHLHLLPGARTPASLAFRALLVGWLARHRHRGVVYARHKRYARLALRLGGRVIWEAHEVDSLQAAERGEDPTLHRELERRLVHRAAGVVTNAPGTLDLLRTTWPDLPSAVALLNASAVRPAPGEGVGIGYLGSLRAWKDLDTLARAAAHIDTPVTLVGADPASAEARRLRALSGARLRVEAPIPYAAVSERLAAFRVLVLPLGQGLLPERLVSPLKLADYLATGRRIVAADHPSVRALTRDFVPYASGDPADLARALTTARDLPPRTPSPRTWATRAAEVEDFVLGTWMKGRQPSPRVPVGSAR